MFCLFTRSAHYNNLQKQEEEEELKSSNANNNNTSSSNNNSNLGPLKDNSNIKSRKSTERVSPSVVNSASSTPTAKINIVERSKPYSDSLLKSNQSTTPKSINRKIVPSLSNQNLIPKHTSGSNSNERPLKCLESLAQQAGVTINESINQPKMEKAQNQQQQVPLQISPEQLQQLQHQFQLQQAFAAGGTAIQVKQEFPQTQANTIEQLNKQIQEQQNQAAQVQQMQLIDASVATSQHQQQNNATMGIKYVNGKCNTIFHIHNFKIVRLELNKF